MPDDDIRLAEGGGESQSLRMIRDISKMKPGETQEMMALKLARISAIAEKAISQPPASPT